MKFLIILIFTFGEFLQVFAFVAGLDLICKNQFDYFESSLKLRGNWALEFFDSWAKYQSGILNGNINNFGDYDACVNFEHVTAVSNIGTIKGQHCMITHQRNVNSTNPTSNFDFNRRELGQLARQNNLKLKSGICLPAACSLRDVRKILTAIYSVDEMDVEEITCTTNEGYKLRIQIIAIVIFAILFMTVIASTIYEIIVERYEYPPCMTLMTFSLYTNGMNLFMTTEKVHVIECLNGIKALSMIWIIFGHRFFDMFMAPSVNGNAATEWWLQNHFSLIHTMFHLAVDNFFVIGGLLVTRSFLKCFDNKDFNIQKAFFHRFLRYSPVLMFMLLFFVTFLKFSGSGPMFHETINMWTSPCSHYWWSTIIHLQNYINIDNLCMNWTWYLSADFQMFVLSPVLVYPAWRWKWKAFWCFPFLILINQVYIFIISYLHNFLVFVGPLSTKGQYDYDRLIYYPTHARYGSWLIGMTLGFIFYHNKGKAFKINRHINRALWVVSLGLMLAVVLGYYPFQQPSTNLQIPIEINALYNAVFRTFWAFGIAWIIYACHHGRGGIIKWFLELSLFQPLAKMSLSIYLTHRVYQIITIATIKQPVWISIPNLIHAFFGDVFASILIGIAVFLFVESPFASLESVLFKK